MTKTTTPEPACGLRLSCSTRAVLVVNCPHWYDREDFQARLNGGPGPATWHPGGEPYDFWGTYVTYDGGEGSDGPGGPNGLPEDVPEEVCRLWEDRMETTHGLVRPQDVGDPDGPVGPGDDARKADCPSHDPAEGDAGPRSDRVKGGRGAASALDGQARGLAAFHAAGDPPCRLAPPAPRGRGSRRHRGATAVMLSGTEIKKRRDAGDVVITPWDDARLNPKGVPVPAKDDMSDRTAAAARCPPALRPTGSPEEVARRDRERRTAGPLADTKIGVRTINTLEAAGVYTIRDLLTPSGEELRSVENLGDRAFEEVCDAIKALGIYQRSWGLRPPRARKPRGVSANEPAALEPTTDVEDRGGAALEPTAIEPGAAEPAVEEGPQDAPRGVEGTEGKDRGALRGTQGGPPGRREGRCRRGIRVTVVEEGEEQCRRAPFVTRSWKKEEPGRRARCARHNRRRRRGRPLVPPSGSRSSSVVRKEETTVSCFFVFV